MSLTIEVFAPLGEDATTVNFWEIQSVPNEQLRFGTWWVWKPPFHSTVQGVVSQLQCKNGGQGQDEGRQCRHGKSHCRGGYQPTKQGGGSSVFILYPLKSLWASLRFYGPIHFRLQS